MERPVSRVQGSPLSIPEEARKRASILDSMPGSVSVFGIRHHGPGSARVLVRALDALNPSIVLIEGPPEATADVIAFAADPQMTPPVALLVYEVEAPTRAVYYPFATYSPEWQALRWALDKSLPARFIDLPESLRDRRPRAERVDPSENPEPELLELELEPPRPRDPLEALARAAGFSDGEAWWGRLIEERRADEHPLEMFTAINDAMASLRGDLESVPHDEDEPAREAFMRKSIRAAIKEGFERIAVVCGAWHAPVLTADALKHHPAKNDDALIKQLTKRKTTATWIPWTYDLLCADSGYGAGVASPGWYRSRRFAGVRWRGSTSSAMRRCRCCVTAIRCRCASSSGG
jgi:hypothetical protein